MNVYLQEKHFNLQEKKKEEEKYHEILRILVKLFNVYFFMKCIKIHLKKEFIEIYILLNTKRFFLSCKKILIKYQ